MTSDRYLTLPEVLNLYLLTLSSIAILLVLGPHISTVPSAVVCCGAIAAVFYRADRRAARTSHSK